MNPILLKPNGNGASQVVVNGRMWKTLSAREYYAHADELRADCARRLRGSREPLRCHRDRRRRQRERAESARARSGQPRARHARSARRGCSSPTSSAAACSARSIGTAAPARRRRAIAVSRLRHQQVPRRHRRCSTTACACSRSEPASRCLGVFPYADGRAPRRRGQPGAQDTARVPAPTGARTGDRPLSASLERDRFPPADVGRLDHRAVNADVRLHHPARQQEHDRRSGVASRDRASPTGLSSAASAAARRSSASAAAIRCSAGRSPIQAASSRRQDGPTASVCLPAITTLDW